MNKENTFDNRKSIKEWETEDRPREKMAQKGVAALTNAELLAILIQNGTHHKSAVDLARELLEKAHQDLGELARMGGKSMMTVKGIGQAKATTLMAALEIGRRKQIANALQKKSIRGSKDAYELLHPILSDLSHEAFVVVYLNTAGKILHYEKISTGGIAGTVVDIRMILKNALQWLASGLIIAHNHPSGNLNASANDHAVTQKLKQAAAYFDIKIADHLIITNNGYYSFADEGKL